VPLRSINVLDCNEFQPFSRLYGSYIFIERTQSFPSSTFQITSKYIKVKGEKKNPEKGKIGTAHGAGVRTMPPFTAK